jgi:hypothetical protein
MEDLTEEQKSHLDRIVAEAANVVGLLQHPGMAVVRKAIDNQTEFNRKKWYTATTPEEAEKIRLKTRGFEDFFAVCEAIVKNGQAAQKALNSPSANAEQGA